MMIFRWLSFSTKIEAWMYVRGLGFPSLSAWVFFSMLSM